MDESSKKGRQRLQKINKILGFPGWLGLSRVFRHASGGVHLVPPAQLGKNPPEFFY